MQQSCNCQHFVAEEQRDNRKASVPHAVSSSLMVKLCVTVFEVEDYGDAFQVGTARSVTGCVS